MKIQLTIFEDAEAWLRKHLPDMGSDGICCVRPNNNNLNLDGMTTYIDVEEDKKKKCSLDDHVRALRQLCEQIGRTLFVGGLKSPYDLVEPGNWDAEVVDAYWQLVMYGEVIYG